jgi:N-acetyl-gamma-glutamyl-phosphate reductase
MLKVAVLGGSGYTGSELIRLLQSHNEVEIRAVTSERLSGRSISNTFLNFRNTSLKFEQLHLGTLIKKADLFFLCLPHKASQETVSFLHNAGKKVIDLSADYRLKSAEVYSEWYKTPHLFSALLKKAVYGLPELHRKKIRKASIIANPGCYPTSALLGLAPVIGKDFVKADSITIDSKSGTSGAGRNPAQPFMFCEVNESVKAYAVTVHRHTPEIEQELSLLCRKKINVVFTPHLMPMDRGILSTIYVPLKKKIHLADVQKRYRSFYRNEPFVRILESGTYPATKAVKGTNYCDISMFLDNRPGRGQTLILVSVIDNLLKGASGTAVHNMNIMYGFDEKTGLMASAVTP